MGPAPRPWPPPASANVPGNHDRFIRFPVDENVHTTLIRFRASLSLRSLDELGSSFSHCLDENWIVDFDLGRFLRLERHAIPERFHLIASTAVIHQSRAKSAPGICLQEKGLIIHQEPALITAWTSDT